MTSAQVLRAMSLGLVDLKDCDARRDAGAKAWPKPTPPETR